MQCWYLRVNPSPNADYDVYYKSAFKLSRENVPRNAVIDGDLLDVFLPKVDIVKEISKEAYYEHMYD